MTKLLAIYAAISTAVVCHLLLLRPQHVPPQPGPSGQQAPTVVDSRHATNKPLTLTTLHCNRDDITEVFQLSSLEDGIIYLPVNTGIQFTVEPDLTITELARIVHLIQTRLAKDGKEEFIRWIKPNGTGIAVETATKIAPLAGSGQIFQIQKKDGAWTITRITHWVS